MEKIIDHKGHAVVITVELNCWHTGYSSGICDVGDEPDEGWETFFEGNVVGGVCKFGLGGRCLTSDVAEYMICFESRIIEKLDELISDSSNAKCVYSAHLSLAGNGYIKN